MPRRISDLRRAIGLAVHDLRELRGWSPTEFAQKAKFSRAYLHKLENGRTNVQSDTLLHLAVTFDMSFMNFMSEVNRRRTEFTPRAFDFDGQILRHEGQEPILVVTRTGRIDASTDAEFVKNVYEYAHSQRLWKVLFNLSAAVCDFSKSEEYQETIEILTWLKERSYWPVVAVVHNATLSPFGSGVAQRDGLNVRLFTDYGEALKWLKGEPINVLSRVQTVL